MTKNYVFQVFIVKLVELAEFGVARPIDKKVQLPSS